MTLVSRSRFARARLLAATILASGLGAAAQAQTMVPSGQMISPTAAPGAVFQDLNPGLANYPNYRAGQAIKTALSPDGTTLLVLTSGYNNVNFADGPNVGYQDNSASTEYVFVYDVSGANAANPVVRQVIQVPDTFEGLTFSPDGTKFYVSGGVDDVIYTYAKGNTGWAQSASVSLGHAPIAAGGGFLAGGNGFLQSPSAGGLAVSPDGATLVVANTYNDSISVISTASNTVSYEYDLRPYNTSGAAGQGVAGGERPFAVALAGNGMLYVSSLRDREVVVLNISSGAAQFVTRIPMSGTPNSLVFDNPAAPTKLYVAQDNSDYIAVVNLADNSIIEQIDAIGPAGITSTMERYTGAAPNNLAISGKTLYVTNGGQNAVAVIPLSGNAPHSTAGLIPAGWYPHALSVSADGKHLYIANGKSDPGANPLNLTGSTYALRSKHYPGGNNLASNEAYGANQYVFQIEKAGLLSLPVPSKTTLATLTTQVASNNYYNVTPTSAAAATMAALQKKITHVIYIVKENRTFDQVLGDLTNGSNANSSLNVFGAKVTPNFHAMANNFVTLDNFYDPAEVSGNGWEWSTAARETDINVKQIPLDYGYSPAPSTLNQGGRGAPYDAEGQNSDVDVGIPTLAGRQQAEPLYSYLTALLPGGTANLLPGTNNDAAPDGPDGAAQTGYLWDSAIRAGLTIRNYGYFIDLVPYNLPAGTPGFIPPTDATPFANNDIQAYSTNPTLIKYTDPYFRSFDNNYPDYWRFKEWQREFNLNVQNNDLPNLTFLRFMHDHMGDFGTSYSKATGLNFPEAEQADDDYAVGLVAQTIANSPYKGNTLIFVVEDDAQDGPDHVDAHRSTAYIVGPYVKQKAIVSTAYTTVNMIRTIEDILGIDHLNLNDAYAAPMADVFDLSKSKWNFTARPSAFLAGTADVTADTKFPPDEQPKPAKPAAWWAEKTKGFDWSREDRVPADRFNRILWEGLKGDAPYPTSRTGIRAGDND